jgi:general secretion pathway protein C
MIRLTGSTHGWLTSLFSTRGAVYVLGKICLFAAVGLAYSTGVTLEALQSEAPVIPTNDAGDETPPAKAKVPVENYRVITDRSIFGRKRAGNPNAAPVVAQADMKLRLVGTNTGPTPKPFAVIEDTAKSLQDVFELNEKVFGQAKLIEVTREYAKLEHNGKIQKLMLDEGAPSASGPAEAGTPDPDATEFTVPEDDLSRELANLPRLLSEARAVPYFRNGQSIGMRLFAIRKDSLYEKLGLQNGDILKGVNDNSLADPSQALKIFEQLKSERSINVSLERGGADRTLHYSIR